MSSDGFIQGLVAATIVTNIIYLAFIFSGWYDHHPYNDCEEDEVYAWQMGYRATYEDREWVCVAIDDLP